jgi:signal transduction histidine kinase
LRADPDRIQQVLWNLVSNALRHTPAGGRVVLSVSAAAADIIFGVRDTGPGIDPELLPYVFDRFRQGTNTKGGLGLGLTISRHIVALHGGTISAQNEHDPPGARFEVRLPSDEGG